MSADHVKLWLKCPTYPATQQQENVPAIYRVTTCHRVFPLYTPLSFSLCCSCCLFPLHTYVHTCTRTHNGCSKFFQGISRLINRLVVWGSSEVQRSRLNPLTGRIISGRWVHTSAVAPHKPLPSWLDLWQNKPPTPPPPSRLPMLLTPVTVNAPERKRERWCKGESNGVRRGWNNI